MTLPQRSASGSMMTEMLLDREASYRLAAIRFRIALWNLAQASLLQPRSEEGQAPRRHDRSRSCKCRDRSHAPVPPSKRSGIRRDLDRSAASLGDRSQLTSSRVRAPAREAGYTCNLQGLSDPHGQLSGPPARRALGCYICCPCRSLRGRRTRKAACGPKRPACRSLRRFAA